MYGELIPIGGGDPIPLFKKRLRVGRREGCDIILSFGNVSSYHCLLELDQGYWFVRDLNSRNGIKINEKKVQAGESKRLNPNDELRIAKHSYEIVYDPTANGAYGTPPQEEVVDDFFQKSLLDRAGLKKS